MSKNLERMRMLEIKKTPSKPRLTATSVAVLLERIEHAREKQAGRARVRAALGRARTDLRSEGK